MKIIGLIVAIVMVIVSTMGICYAVHCCFGLMASMVYMAVVIVALAWTIYEVKHASISDE